MLPEEEITEWLHEDAAKAKLMELAETLDEVFNGADPRRSTGFMLIVNYRCAGEDQSSLVSNMPPDQLKTMLKLQLARLEGQSFQPGRA